MSTRSIVGIKSESGKIGRYCHSDGYPDGQLPILAALIKRDGAPKAAQTLMEADAGGWSYLSTTYANNSLGKDRAELIEGYGLKYLDAPDRKAPMRFEEAGDSWCEYAYFIDVERGTIEWYEMASTPRGPYTFTPGDDLAAHLDATQGS